jgi:hypothetical protein
MQEERRMTTYVLGAGASHDAGYPLANAMGSELFRWMKDVRHPAGSYAAQYPATAQFLEESFGTIANIEDLATAIEDLIAESENGTEEERAKRSVVANEYGVLKNAVREWFAFIQRGTALSSSTYQAFAREIVASGDCIITFNYDVSLERELRLAGRFEIGDGYGFSIEGLPGGSATKVLKLHGSTSWLALLFGGIKSGFSQFSPGSTLGSRPVIGKNELSFLGYSDAAVDPRFARGGAALPVMIFPARSKQFYFGPNTGTEYVRFWNDLWSQARVALQSATHIVICGYSLNAVDKRARELLLGAPKPDAEIVVASGADTKRIVTEYREAGYRKATASDEILFQRLIEKSAASTHAG